ncbi:collagen alpha-6(VI) chain [Elysia marginata]|uniref:Collagen alpha-6(VI) chain n=1 Tax=Elysia marginata TaxID=1093978 RepID=A0AAV4FBD6_9GAST|nr:collagen alpha-6(VI) chain [Elysia marginata]
MLMITIIAIEETNSITSPDKCLYDGIQYSQDQFWYVGSDTRCVCENAISGYYRCVNLCPSYTNLPASCTVKQSATSTCDVISCTSGTFVSSSNNFGSIGNGGNIVKGSPDTFVPPTRPSGEQAPPGTGGSPDNAPTLQGCLYNGKLYVQGQRWDDGCSKSCECLDALTGNTKCRQRCPDYTQVPNGCSLVADPDDPCCVKPKCADPSVTPVPHFQTYTTNFRPVAPPTDNNRFTGTGGFEGPSGGQATLIQTGTPVPTVPAGTRRTTGSGIGVCNYAGKIYKQNETWKDGCDYNCRCDDASYGHYTCTQICVVYKDIPFPYCRLIQDPNNPCCKIPSCIWTAPVEIFTDFAVVNPTTPGVKVTNPPPAPSGYALCEYKGKTYDRDQVWYDGCDYKCTCEEPATNKYRCDSRCPEFPNSANCKFVKDPKDPTCCEVPVCPTPSPGPGETPDPTPTPQKGIVTGGVTPGTVPGNKGYCEYNGQRYQQGEMWDDGCEYNCVCEDAVTGKYKCTEKCARYPELAPNCRLIDDFANPCCKVPRCDPVPESTTVSPGPNSGTSVKPPVQEYCVYNGVQYATGQQWVDGCDKKCQCDNQDTGVYSCTERCITYDNLPPECKLVTDPNDACCRVPQCGTPSPRITPAPPTVPGNTQVPGSAGPTPATRVTDVPTPPPVTGKVTGYANVPTPSPGPGGSTGAPPTRTFCEYKGTRYNQNEKWTDGCQFDCECVQALVGKYECLEKCARYVNLPAGCRLVKDPSNPCCEIPDCPAVPPQQASTTVAPGPGVTTVSPRPGGPTDTPAPPSTPSVCVYKGQQYTQGQKWYDGCDYACECEDAMQGVYRCDNRCPTYNSVPSGCHYESDPRDPFCCKMIRCDIPQTVNNKTGTGLIPTPPPGQKTGGYVTPAPTPFNPNNPTPMAGQPTPSPIPQGICVYKGRQYQVGSKWQDGCDSSCECLDTTGLYRCTEM